jgi:hypothetical protein
VNYARRQQYRRLSHAGTAALASAAAALLELPRELLQLRLIDRHTRNGGHGLAVPACDLRPPLGVLVDHLPVELVAEARHLGRVHSPVDELRPADYELV